MLGPINTLMSTSLADMDVYHLFSTFFIYSFLGWVVESIYMSICNGKLTNRGFIRGPICPIYGVAANAIYLILYPVSGNYVAVYFCGLVLATTFEYAVARLMIHVFGEVWWDYRQKPFNYKGLICLESSVAWGFYCVMLFAFLQKGAVAFVDYYTDVIGMRAGRLILMFLTMYYLISFVRAVRRHAGDEAPIEGNFGVENGGGSMMERYRRAPKE